MSTMRSFIVFLFVTSVHFVSVQSLLNQTTLLSPTVIPTEDGRRSCPSQQQRDASHQMIKNAVAAALRLDSSDPTVRCGAGQWTRVAFLDMNDPFQFCPSAWRLNASSGIRRCGRPSSSNDMCHGTSYSSGGRTYTKVCGRVIGYQVGHPDAFHSSDSINEAYVEGVSITHGSPRSHIWTLAAGRSEIANSDCPCAAGSSQTPPSFVGNNYYCESGNQNTSTVNYHLYASDPLWDGQQCDSEGTCCSGGKSPPWFSVDLIRSTSDSIEVRICSDFDTSEDTPIQLLELYIQ